MGWLQRLPGTTRPFRGKFPIKVGIPMTTKMVGFLDSHAEELANHLGSKVTRADLVRECVARIAYDHFGEDIGDE